MNDKEKMIQEVLLIDSEIANLDTKQNQLRKKIEEIFYQQFAKNKIYQFKYKGIDRIGIIEDCYLDKHNPFEGRIKLKVLRKDMKPNLQIGYCVISEKNIVSEYHG